MSESCGAGRNSLPASDKLMTDLRAFSLFLLLQLFNHPPGSRARGRAVHSDLCGGGMSSVRFMGPFPTLETFLLRALVPWPSSGLRAPIPHRQTYKRASPPSCLGDMPFQMLTARCGSPSALLYTQEKERPGAYFPLCVIPRRERMS